MAPSPSSMASLRNLHRYSYAVCALLVVVALVLVPTRAEKLGTNSGSASSFSNSSPALGPKTFCNASLGSLDTFSGRSRVKFINNTMTIVPLVSGQELSDTYAQIEWLGVQEFWRSSPATNLCAEPDAYPTPPASMLVTVVQTVDIRSMYCQVQSIEESLGDDVLMRTLHILITDPFDDSFYLEFNVSTTNRAVNVTYNDPTPHVAQYREEAFKFTYIVESFPWRYHNNESYLTSSWRTEFGVPSPWNYLVLNGNNMSQSFVETLDGRINVHQIFDTVFYTELATLVRGPRDQPIFNYSNLPAMKYGRILSFSFCDLHPPMLHYRTLRYDPSLAILLSSPAEDTTSPTTGKSKDKSKGLLVAQIVVPIVVIVAACVGAAIIWRYRSKIMKPTVKKEHVIGSM